MRDNATTVEREQPQQGMAVSSILQCPETQTDQPSQSALLKGDDAAKMLDISRAHFYRMHNAGKIPLPVRLGGCVRWRVDELLAWIEAGMPNRQRWQAMKGGA